MADDRTEKATPKRLREARKKGEIAKSTELSGAAVLMAGLAGIMFLGPKVVAGASGAMRTAFATIAKPGEVSSGAGLHGLMEIGLKTLESTVAPIIGICVACVVVANVSQTRGRMSMAALKPDFRRLNPVTGFKQIFGKRVGFELAKVLAKVSVVGAMAAMSLVPQITQLGANVGTTPGALGSLLSSGAKSIIERVLIVYVLIALIDFIHARRRHSKQLKMTKQEVKDEFKQTQLPPEVKAALRRRQQQAARARMMAAVPTADVVVTNPTHYAVALRYDGNLPAPVVVAKGKNLVAVQLRRIATENNVPIVPDPPLARSLHASVEIDRMIPAELYAAVAQVLAFVYRLAGRGRIAA
ncbi:MAG TPA: EscU/YscU/HrcU family type III secretion system export apparatus switch protein [Solirubrobacteraceae bacterium]|jgi:flagellar biosynthetic protein FlhB|nr:EscU/YscU/HrcU family type III secretion system export apparatus switch protein [Solirubrobacteraceae bacterium]